MCRHFNHAQKGLKNKSDKKITLIDIFSHAYGTNAGFGG